MREWLPAGFPLICLDTEEYHAGTAADLPGTPHPANLMYIMYTSGSTGSPKGVEVTHGGIANRLAWDRRHVPLGPADAVLQLTSPLFDPFGWEVFASLSSGARLVLLPPGGHRDPQEVLRTIVAEEVTAITLIPAQLALLMDQRPGLHNCPSLRYVFCGGDVLAPSLAAAFPVDGRPALYNMYRPDRDVDRRDSVAVRRANRRDRTDRRADRRGPGAPARRPDEPRPGRGAW